MQVGDTGQADTLLRFDVRQKAKLDIRSDDAELKLRLKAKLSAEVRALASDVDRGASARTVFRISESIKLRMHLEAGGEGADSLRERLGALAETFATSLTELASGFASPEGASPEALVSGLRAAFGGLIDGIRSLFSGQAEIPAEVPAEVPAPAPNDDADVTDGSGSTPASETSPAEDAPSTPAPAPDRLFVLRHDLHLRFTAGLRVLTQQLSGLPPLEGPNEPGDETAPGPRMQSELRARFDLHQRLAMRLIDTRA